MRQCSEHFFPPIFCQKGWNRIWIFDVRVKGPYLLPSSEVECVLCACGTLLEMQGQKALLVSAFIGLSSNKSLFLKRVSISELGIREALQVDPPGKTCQFW